eukprot:1332092-Alexandrium_andersonii.AAC.1
MGLPCGQIGFLDLSRGAVPRGSPSSTPAWFGFAGPRPLLTEIRFNRALARSGATASCDHWGLRPWSPGKLTEKVGGPWAGLESSR